jgi:hypothetical protein
MKDGSTPVVDGRIVPSMAAKFKERMGGVMEAEGFGSRTARKNT